MCDKLSHSVTLPAIASGKRVTRKHLATDSAVNPASEILKPPNSGTSKKLAWLLLCLTYNKNNKCNKPIKTRRIGSDITRTTRTETQLTDFFGVDRCIWGLGLRTGLRTIKLSSGSYQTGRIERSKRISAQKNTFALDPGLGSLIKAKKAGCQKQQQAT
jgi:hypothetical protein